MTNADLNILNQSLVAGAAWNITENIDYDTVNHDLKSYFKKADSPSSAVTTITAGKVSGNFVWAVTAANTAGFAKGTYRVQVGVFLAGTSELVELIEQTVNINKIYSTGEDVRTDNEKILDALIAARSLRATREQSEITLPSGKTIKYLTGEMLDKEISQYRRYVRQEQAALQGKSTNPRIRIGF